MPRVRSENFHQFKPFQRGRTVTMRQAGLSFDEIGRHVTIRRIYRDWQEEDLEARHRGSGRPRATQEREDRLLGQSVL